MLACVAGIAAAETGAACSCGDVADRMNADVIFQGEAVEVHRPLHLGIRPPSSGRIAPIIWRTWFVISRKFDPDVRTVFRVNEAWRGGPAQFVTVNTGSGICCDCSVGDIFTAGSSYVVYAVRYRGELLVEFCSGGVVPGKRLPPVDASLLGRSSPPSSGPRAFPMFWRHLSLPMTVVTAIVLMVSAVSWISKRRGVRNTG